MVCLVPFLDLLHRIADGGSASEKYVDHGDRVPLGKEIGKGAKWVAWLLPLQIAHNLEICFRTMFVLFLQKALFAVLCQLLLRHPGGQGLQFTVAEHYLILFVVVVESREVV